MTDSIFISQADLEFITKAKQKKKQVDALQRLGIPYFDGRDGIGVLKEVAVKHLQGLNKQPSTQEIDWESVRKAS